VTLCVLFDNLELAHQFEELVTLFNFFLHERLDPVETERFNAEAGQQTSVNDCF
jgi:hypothetical protein